MIILKKHVFKISMTPKIPLKKKERALLTVECVCLHSIKKLSLFNQTSGKSFQGKSRLSVWDIGISLIGQVLTGQANPVMRARMNFCQSRRVHAHMLGELKVIALIGTLSSNQKYV